MAVTEECWLDVLVQCPGLENHMAEPRLSWWPIALLDTEDLSAFGQAICCVGSGEFIVGWDGAVARQARPGVCERWCEIAVRAQAQWTATTNAIEGSRTALRTSRASIAALDASPMPHLLTARFDLVEALVELDARVGLYYEFELGFVREIFSRWQMSAQIDQAQKCLDSVSSLISISQQQAALLSQRLQEDAARSAAFWLFLVSMASGVAVLLAAIDFVSLPRSPTVGNVVRLGILLSSLVVTGVVSWRQRKSVR